MKTVDYIIDSLLEWIATLKSDYKNAEIPEAKKNIAKQINDAYKNLVNIIKNLPRNYFTKESLMESLGY